MVAIPDGTFAMGENKNIVPLRGIQWPAENAGKVTAVIGFCMDRTEVTMSAYAACVASGKCTIRSKAFVASFDAHNINDATDCNESGRDSHPVNCVTHEQATAYCAAQGLRLPTEEEWEYAARGTDGRIYPWGNENPKDQLCWNGGKNINDQDYGNKRHKTTCPVGSYPNSNSPFGLVDMAGNLAEFTASLPVEKDWRPADTKLDELRIVRGGHYVATFPPFVSTTNRDTAFLDLGATGNGFRCAGSPLP